MQVDRVVRRPHLKSEGQGFKLRSVHLLEQYHSGPEFNSSPLVDSQLACLLLASIPEMFNFDLVMFYSGKC